MNRPYVRARRVARVNFGMKSEWRKPWRKTKITMLKYRKQKIQLIIRNEKDVSDNVVLQR